MHQLKTLCQGNRRCQRIKIAQAAIHVQADAILQVNNRLHCKIAAIDGHTVFLGGSNIGDYYTTWTDSNLRVDGDFVRVGTPFALIVLIVSVLLVPWLLPL